MAQQSQVLSFPTCDERSTSDRIAALDGLRAGAMFLGVCLHAAVSYMPSRMPGLLWVVHDGAGHWLFDLLFWWLHAFRLPLFFFLAGFFAALVEAKRGLNGLLFQRIHRVFVPFLAGCLFLLPLAFYIWTAGWLVAGRCTVKEILAVKFGPAIQSEIFGPLHLWFLEDLFLLTLAFCAVRFWLGRRPQRPLEGIDPPTHRAWPRWFSPLILAVPTALVLSLNLKPVIAHHNSFVPDGWRLLYYGLFFLAGALVYPRRQRLLTICNSWILYLSLSLIPAAMLLPLLQRHIQNQDDWAFRMALAATLSLSAWLSLFGFLGFGLRWGNGSRPVLRYLADASYWVYLCHLPLVGLIQLDLEGVDCPAGMKFVLVVALTALLALASYHTLIRYTFVGTCLHGPRRRSAARSDVLVPRRAA